jgi:hypothetical protein
MPDAHPEQGRRTIARGRLRRVVPDHGVYCPGELRVIVADCANPRIAGAIDDRSCPSAPVEAGGKRG